jgi:N-hydroxyarylamine O-acetyltransferase
LRSRGRPGVLVAMSSHTIDLDAYFARIGYTGARAATPAALREIHHRHVCAIPFENLDVLLGRGIRIDVPSIERKLVHERRGGYCFEQNGLLAAVLRALGFRVTPLIARVRWQVPAEVTTPLTHKVLRVEAGGAEFLADVGFGSMSLFEPLVLEYGPEQSRSLEPRRLVRDGDAVVQQARLGDTWFDVYRFALVEAPAVDFEMGNWFTSTHPQSRFVQNLTVAIAGDKRRLGLFNRDFSVRHADGRSETRTLATRAELLHVLATEFGLQLPAETRFGDAGSPWPT